MVTITGNDNYNTIDLSIMPTLECDLYCRHCMYDAGPHHKKRLDLQKTKEFLETVSWQMINSIGFYGGEPSINLALYQKFINLIPEHIPRWLITNGTWSTNINKTCWIMNFVISNNMTMVVSGTEHHLPYQNRYLLHNLKQVYPHNIRLKGEEDRVNPMGRGMSMEESVPCSKECREYLYQIKKSSLRAAIHPTGNIIYQNCKGVYPVIQSINQPFDGLLQRARKVAQICCFSKEIR